MTKIIAAPFAILLMTWAAICASPGGPIVYTIRIDPSDITGVNVEMQIPAASPITRLTMAAHPEYDDRYYRFIKDLTAVSGTRRLSISQSENIWSISGAGRQLTVRYRLVFPPQQGSARDAWKPFLTGSGGMVGDLHMLMYVVGQQHRPAVLKLNMPGGWTASTGLKPTSGPTEFRAENLEELLDSPVLVGNVKNHDFTVDGIPHRVAIWSEENARPYDPRPLTQGIERLTRETIKVLGRPPYPRYTFLVQNGGSAALEHMTSLNVGHDMSRDLDGVFEEIAHEYIHVYNLMDVRPRERIGLRPKQAEPTGTLWWSEGATIYLASMLVQRLGLNSDKRTRLQSLDSVLNRYFAAPGYSKHPAELVSRSDTDPLLLGNDFASTHLQGEILSVALDLDIRSRTQDRRSLVDVLKLLSSRFDYKRGMANKDIQDAIEQVCSCDQRPFFRQYIRGGNQIDINRYLSLIGYKVDLSRTPAVKQDGSPEIDLRLSVTDSEPPLKLRITSSGSEWSRSGLKTGDILTSADGAAIGSWNEMRRWLVGLKIGSTAKVGVLRNGRALSFSVPIRPYDRQMATLSEIPNASAQQLRMRAEWLAFR